MVEGMLRADLTGMHFTSKIGSCSLLESKDPRTHQLPPASVPYIFLHQCVCLDFAIYVDNIRVDLGRQIEGPEPLSPVDW